MVFHYPVHLSKQVLDFMPSLPPGFTSTPDENQDDDEDFAGYAGEGVILDSVVSKHFFSYLL